jgi:dipeptidyl aminopeptidase/acylaminoacyl peptidase
MASTSQDNEGNNNRVAADATSLTNLVKVGRCFWPSFSPDGTQLAFISDLTGIPQVWTVSTTGGWPTQVTSLDDPVTKVSWSSDGKWLALLVAPGGGMNQQIYLVAPDGTQLHRITDGGKENNWLGPWNHDSRFLALSSNRHNPAASACYLYDLETNQLKLITENPGLGYVVDLSPDAKLALVNRVEHRSDSNLFLVDLQQQKEFLLTPHEGPGAFDLGHFSADGTTVYLMSNLNRDKLAFAKVKLASDGIPGPVELLLGREDAELQTFSLTPDGKQALLVWNVAGQSELAFLDLDSGQARNGPALPAEVVMFEPDLSKDGRWLALALTGSIAPPDIWLLDLKADQPSFQQLTHSPHPGVQLKQLVKPQLVKFPAHDGLELSGWLYQAQASAGQPGPLVLIFHGGPEGQERPNFISVYQGLLARGISVLAPNVRGSSGFGKNFVNLDNGPLRHNAIRDIEACAEYVVKSGVADPKRIGIMGGSYGGYMTMIGLTTYPDLFAAGANLYGIVNFETFFAHTEPWMAAVSKIEYGDPETEVELLRELSPVHKLDRLRAPTLVLHGANDTNVPVVEATQLVEILRQRGVTVEYLLFEDEGHGFRKLVNRIRVESAIINWFETYL